jgi:hypothetical protein
MSVWDSGPIEVDDQVTCLVGKNEAGKTALLTALYRTNPIIPGDPVFDETYDYPKREVEDYRFAVEHGEREEAVIVECVYDLDDADIQEVSDVFGTTVLKDITFSVSSYYGKNKHTFLLRTDDCAARLHLADNPALPDVLRDTLRDAGDWDGFAAVLETGEVTAHVKGLKGLVTKVREHGLPHYIFNSLIWPRLPKFLYFDEYYQMQGRANLDALVQREDANKLENSDYPLLGLINLARLDHRELVGTKNTAELKNKLEGAGNYLTRTDREVLVTE